TQVLAPQAAPRRAPSRRPRGLRRGEGRVHPLRAREGAVKESPGLPGRVLRLCCDACAMAGGLILLAMAGMTLASVIGRAFFARPVPGDVELVQIGTAVCIALFLPYTQLRG